ncbi:hypothetical protein PAMA_007016 [Pampus argenteus]
MREESPKSSETIGLDLRVLPAPRTHYHSKLSCTENKSRGRENHLESGRAGLEDDEEFVDILEERRRSSDLSHAFRTFSPQPYGGGTSCSSGDLSKAVLDSQYLRYVTEQIATETGSSVEAVREEACVIMEEMSQNLQLGFIRLMGFTLSKVFKRVFTSIFVNMEGLNTLQQAIQDSPVILMPNHRSYVDFLVISYLLFTYDIPVPVIAAGIRNYRRSLLFFSILLLRCKALAGMKMVGEILRRSGAFFIRRAIGSDKLYWAVLSEYVKTIVRKGFAPVEFYVEGFRSRTLKSLTPRLGMMHMVLEPYFKSEVYDVTLVPISISYDRVLEESLLAHELLGVPKPKESTTGLLKASSVLQENYGSMHVNFGRPVSVRQLCQGKMDRCQYNLIPRDLPQTPTPEVQSCVSWLAHLIVRTQEEGSLTSPWSLMACLLLQTPTAVLTEAGLLWQQLTEKTLWLRKLALTFGARLNWPGHVPDSDVMSSSMAIHRSTVQRKAGRVYLVQEEEPARKHLISPEEAVVRTAVPVLMLASYRNQTLHIFVRPALLVMAIHVTKSTQRGECWKRYVSNLLRDARNWSTVSILFADELFSFFCFLQGVFSSEFIFIPGESSQDFEEACFLLKKCGALCFSQQEVTVSETEAGVEVLSFLQALLQPFIDSYQVIFRYLYEEVHVISEKDFIPAVRSLATKLILSGKT